MVVKGVWNTLDALAISAINLILEHIKMNDKTQNYVSILALSLILGNTNPTLLFGSMPDSSQVVCF